jgi:NAD+ kinase
MRKRVILVGDRRRPGLEAAVSTVREALADRMDLVAVDLDDGLDLQTADADLVVIFGGDGSILYTARRMGSRPIPSIGVNFGKFGFLTDILARDAVDDLRHVLDGEGKVEHRLVLTAEVVSADGARQISVLNEFYLGPSRVGRVVTLDLLLDGEYATTYRGDGLLVATPTGSTGHSLSAGGPILDPNMDAIVLTPVSPHSLTNRPLVIPADTEVHLRSAPDGDDGRATFSCDGQVAIDLASEDEVRIRRASYRFPLVRTGLRKRYDVLRSRLGWSGKPPWNPEDES